jgi:hypothetical protein
MDKKDRKILTYLTEKETVARSAVINETFSGFGLTKEEYMGRLENLQKRDFIHQIRPVGDQPFIRITEHGRNALKPLLKKEVEFLERHILEILTLIVATVTLVLTIK